MRKKLEFESQGNTLAGLLEYPESGTRCYALFAHCFTCGKDIAAASRISSALVKKGIAVLRFDFTGLGNSDGDFSNTHFSSNVQDLLAAADYLTQHYQAPALMIGHSLGGAAVLSAAAHLPEVKALVTIGAPFNAKHVVHNFHASVEEINREGQANVTLAGRKFLIKKQFLDDLEAQTEDHIHRLRQALLVMHSPVDQTVNITEAEKIYRAAVHPKSFISLDSSDHLVSKKQDSLYVADAIAGWAGRYLPLDDEDVPNKTVSQGHVVVEEKDHAFLQHVASDHHYWLADEPRSVGGADAGPDPYEHLLAALGACTAMTVRMVANRKKFPLEHVRVELSHDREHNKDCEGCEDSPRQIEVIDRQIELVGELTVEERKNLMQIADKCPVHRTLHAELEVRTTEV